jgi:hypothetical protein
MPLGGAFVDSQLLGNLSVREPVANQTSDLGLPLGQDRSSSTSTGRKTEKVANLPHERINVADEGEMRPSWELNEARTFDTRRDQLALRQRGRTITFSVEHQGRSSDLVKTVGHVDVVAADEELRRGLSRGGLALILSQRSARRSRCFRSEDLSQDI